MEEFSSLADIFVLAPCNDGINDEWIRARAMLKKKT